MHATLCPAIALRCPLVLIGLSTFLLPLSSALGQCDRDLIQVNTGYNHSLSSGGVYPAGSQDPFYELIYAHDGTTVPRPANVVAHHQAWVNPAPDTQWLSPFTTAIDTTNGTFVFQTAFCLQPGFHDVVLTVGARVDDAVYVFLNESLDDVLNYPTSGIVPIHTGIGFGSTVLFPTTFSTQSKFNVGQNLLMYRLDNLGGGPTGFDAVVSLSAPGFLATDPACCSLGGTIQGQKWNDLNADSIWQPGEPALAYWTINLSNGATTTTDHNGFYYFINLPPGVYTVTETPQLGWTQTYPANGGPHTLALASDQNATGVDFGNHACLNITTQPVDQPICPSNSSGTFSLAVAGADSPAYQWQAWFNGAWVNLVNGNAQCLPCGTITGATTPTVTVSPATGTVSGACSSNPIFVAGSTFRCLVTIATCTLASESVMLRPLLCCGSADFNCDGDLGTDADIAAFFACLAGNCPAPPCPNSADFNVDGDTGTDADIGAFFRVLAGGSC